jgi:hypothetical protein
MATQSPPPNKPGKPGDGEQGVQTSDVELLKVVVTREGQKGIAQ